MAYADPDRSSLESDIMEKRFWKVAVAYLSVLILAVQMRIPGFAAENVFDDVAIDSPWYESIRYIADRGITSGTGNGMFSADAPITARQWAAMLCRDSGDYEMLKSGDSPFGKACVKKAYQNGWLPLETVVDSDAKYSRCAIYENLLS